MFQSKASFTVSWLKLHREDLCGKCGPYDQYVECTYTQDVHNSLARGSDGIPSWKVLGNSYSITRS